MGVIKQPLEARQAIQGPTHALVARGIDTLPLALALKRRPELFGQHDERRYGGAGPHAGMRDIWVRYNRREDFDAGVRQWSEFNDLHVPTWYPVIAQLPEVLPIVRALMRRVDGEWLGGVLITRLPPDEGIASHVDSGWHASTFDKYYVAIDHAPGSIFGFPDGVIEAQPGDAWWFRNDVPHEVMNGGDRDRLAMIVCIQHGVPSR